MSQYYYILNSRPKKPKMKPVTFNNAKQIAIPVVKEEVKVEEMPEFDVESAKKHLQPLQQDVVAEPAVEEAVATAAVVEETPKKKRRSKKSATDVIDVAESKE